MTSLATKSVLQEQTSIDWSKFMLRKQELFSNLKEIAESDFKKNEESNPSKKYIEPVFFDMVVFRLGAQNFLSSINTFYGEVL